MSPCRVLALVVAVALGAASAQVSPPPVSGGFADFVGVGRDAAARIIQAATDNDIALAMNGSAGTIATEAATVGVSAARLLAWQGGIAVSTIAINAGLNLYMQQFQTAINPAAPKLTALRNTKPTTTPGSSAGHCSVYLGYTYPDGTKEYQANVFISYPSGEQIIDNPIASTAAGVEAKCAADIAAKYPGVTVVPGTSTPGQYANSYDRQYDKPGACTMVPTPLQALSGYQDSCANITFPPDSTIAGEVRNIAKSYVQQQPVSAANVSSGDLMPGVKLTPTPTADQVAGKTSGPAFIVSMDTTNIRNPDGSTTQTVTTKMSDGSSLMHTVRVSTVTTTNLDMSVKTTTTTTTTDTTTGPDGQPTAAPTSSTKVETNTGVAPAPVPTTQAGCDASGGTWSGSSCTPKADPCPPGSTTCTIKDPGDTCGDFSVARALNHPGSYLRDVFVPCEPVGELLAPSIGLLKTKFPFSLSASLNGWFAAASTGSAGPVSALPAALGPIPLDWGWLSTLWGLIKTLVGILLWSWFVYYLIDRFTPKAVV